MTVGSASATIASFGALPNGQAVEHHTLMNAAGVQVDFLNLGGIIRAVRVPDRNGTFADVAPGYDSLGEYLTDSSYFGALIGRYANRIADARFTLDGVTYRLPSNDGPHHLHGGPLGFHRALWLVDAFTTDTSVGAVLSYTSPAGEEGFPGVLDVRITYTLTNDSELVFDYTATSDEPTPVNLTQHAYFNLAGHGAGDILDHQLGMTASRYLPVDAHRIPTGEIRLVDGTPFDFRTMRPIRATPGMWRGRAIEAYDHNFVLDGGSTEIARPVARLYEPRSGRVLEVETTAPGLQFYDGGGLARGINGKGGVQYGPYSALALESQLFPNSPNEPGFPSTILRPGSVFRSRTIYRFTTA